MEKINIAINENGDIVNLEELSVYVNNRTDNLNDIEWLKNAYNYFGNSNKSSYIGLSKMCKMKLGELGIEVENYKFIEKNTDISYINFNSKSETKSKNDLVVAIKDVYDSTIEFQGDYLYVFRVCFNRLENGEYLQASECANFFSSIKAMIENMPTDTSDSNEFLYLSTFFNRYAQRFSNSNFFEAAHSKFLYKCLLIKETRKKPNILSFGRFGRK